MDEAEQLADRVAFLAHGRLVCYGSMSFLRSQYETGYFLRVQPQPQGRVDTSAVLGLIKHILGDDAHVNERQHIREKDVDSLLIELPTNQKSNLAELCEELEVLKDSYRIGKFSLRQVSLNDIFIKICNAVVAEGGAMDLYVRRNSTGDIKTTLTTELPELMDKNELDRSSGRQFMTLLKKHWILAKSTYKATLAHFVVPLIIIVVVVYQAKIFVQVRNENPSRDLNTEPYPKNLELFYRMGMDDPTIVRTCFFLKYFSTKKI